MTHVTTVPKTNGAVQLDGRGSATATSGQYATWMLVTPELAAQWLTQNGPNRAIKRERVATLAAAMQRGEWAVTGEAIKIGEDGLLHDGQHRLSAVVLSGVPMQTLVVFNIPTTAFDVMDTGVSRKPGDVLAIHGVASSITLAAMIRRVIAWERRGTWEIDHGALQAITVREIVDAMDTHPSFLSDVRFGGRISTAVGRTTTFWSIFVNRLCAISDEDAQRFFDRLISGAGLAETSPELALRKALQDPYRKITQTEVAAYVIKAWNNYRDAVPTKLMRFRPSVEAFPVAK